jgi:serine/threonine protein kinase
VGSASQARSRTISAYALGVPTEEGDDYSAILAPPQQPGELGSLGPYRVLELLGRGGMGVVFRAEDVTLARPVALKVLAPAHGASTEARARFLREAQAAAALQHDHVVTIFQVGEDRGVLYLAMQLLEGETLDARLRREPRLPLATVLRLGREIADGLAAAHARHLIHRDIKPSNIWLEARRDRVKLLDFGLARALGDDAQLTKSGAVMGTPAYMSPEQARGQVLGTRSDLFSLGCVLYQMVTERLPFRGADTLATLSALALETPPPVAGLNPAAPAALAELIDRLLAKDPMDRPASAREVYEALAAIEQTLPPAWTAVPYAAPATEAPPRLVLRPSDTPTLLTNPTEPRPRWPAAVAADVVALVLFASGLYFLFRTVMGPR